ncbi:MAG TPA: hypothetical protein VET90_01800, partial [Candidatus Binatus sp.]|nr:hypothetical protein [Candidatus Binatus sp.]
SNSAGVIAIGATGTIYLSYFLCNVGVLFARLRGWPHKPASFRLGSWGTIINVLAILYGAFGVVNFALWTSPLFGDFGTQTYTIPATSTAAASVINLRDLVNPPINQLSFLGGNVMSSLPAIPLFEVTLGLIVVVGAVYYLVTERGHLATEGVTADEATGEAILG